MTYNRDSTTEKDIYPEDLLDLFHLLVSTFFLPLFNLIAFLKYDILLLLISTPDVSFV